MLVPCRLNPKLFGCWYYGYNVWCHPSLHALKRRDVCRGAGRAEWVQGPSLTRESSPGGGRLWFREGIDVKNVFKEAPWERIPDTQCMTHVYTYMYQKNIPNMYFWNIPYTWIGWWNNVNEILHCSWLCWCTPRRTNIGTQSLVVWVDVSPFSKLPKSVDSWMTPTNVYPYGKSPV